MAHKKYIAELDELTASMERKPQKVGFVHRFFIPGWIGFIQECIIENKMSKAAKLPIYKGMNYYECGDKIVELTEKACEARKNSEGFQEKENENKDNISILNSSFRAIDAWANIYPEIAYWMNRQVNGNYVTCALGIVQENVICSLSDIIELPDEKKNHKPKPSFMGDMKAIGGQIAAWFCNILVFAAVSALIGAIID
ncbi:MAG: hypothetical protein K2I37_03070 [Muribaculaceae bacterium]|nr:hypothetical protein [Muribaculaceae bacterium]